MPRGRDATSAPQSHRTTQPLISKNRPVSAFDGHADEH